MKRDIIETPYLTVAYFYKKLSNGEKIYRDNINYWLVDKNGMINLMGSEF